MRNVALLTALLCAFAVLSVHAEENASAAGSSAAADNKNLAKELDKYIGRSLAQDDRAAMADVRNLLPESCPPFYLRDEFGRIIDPTINPDISTPVSTRQTCGAVGCHDVGKVCEGYHFQMGRAEMKKEPGLGEPIPMSLSPGLFGKWDILYQRQLAPKTFEDPDSIDLTAFDWVRELGVYHPGGGPAELDRGEKRYSDVMAGDTFLSRLGDGDYYNAKWNESGVIEPDCFICHLDTYHYSSRAQQIKKLNYKWASTEASGIATVEGAVADGEVPKLHYKPNLFDHEGKVNLHIRRPDDRACLTCHSLLSVRKRGTPWHSNYTPDVHTDLGIKCIDCHQGDIRHNFAKGFSSNMTVREDLDGTCQSCKECHYETHDLGAPAHEHKGLTKLHLDRLDCVTCHITKRSLLSARVVETLTGKTIDLANVPQEPTNRLFGADWGTTDSIERDAVLYPIASADIQKAAQLTGVTDLPEGLTVRQFIEQDGTGIVNSSLKRRVMLRALQQVLGLTRDDSIVCVFRGKVSRLYKDEVEGRAAELKPKRSGDIAEYSVAYAWHEADGKQVMRPQGYQLGSFWAFQDGEVVRPLFLRDMKAAWDYVNFTQADSAANGTVSVDGLEDGTFTPGPYYSQRLYPGTPTNGEAPAAIPTGAEVNAEVYDKAVKAKTAQYGTRFASMPVPEVFDDNMDMQPELNTEDEIALMGWAISAANPRLAGAQLYYIRGNRTFAVTVEGTANPFSVDTTQLAPMPTDRPFVVSVESYFSVKEKEGGGKTVDKKVTGIRAAAIGKVEEIDPASNPQLAALAQPLEFTISHGVEPSSMALGANGCTDCHSTTSDFFFSARVTDPFDAQAVQRTEPAYVKMGYTPAGIQYTAWREGIVKPLTPWAVLLVLAAIVLHFTMFGSKRGDQLYIPDIQRFNFVERYAHLGLLVSVVYLCATGFCFLLGMRDPLGEFSRTAHALAGYVAGASFIIVTLCWLKDMFPQKGDFKWMMNMGGYMGGKGHYPAHKFNAGQKVLFWMAVCLMAVLVITGVVMALNKDNRFPQQQLVYTLHDAAAFVMILLLIGHIYLAAFVNPHCMWTLFGGKVSSKWAKEHHPDWKALKK